MPDRPRLFRGLRIAWSVGCLIVCVLMVAWWVRSCHWVDQVGGQTSNVGIGGWSIPGSFGIGTYNSRPMPRWYAFGIEADEFLSQTMPPELQRPRKLRGNFRYGDDFVQIPFWFTILTMVALTAIPWIPWSPRFSLRTLLIVTTFIAVGVGLIARAAR